jgi:hypothetical protein
MIKAQEAEFLECQIWFVVRSQSAIESDSMFCVIMSPEKAIEFLKAHLTPTASNEAHNG